jgi:hypothetical protein
LAFFLAIFLRAIGSRFAGFFRAALFRAEGARLTCFFFGLAFLRVAGTRFAGFFRADFFREAAPPALALLAFFFLPGMFTSIRAGTARIACQGYPLQVTNVGAK